MLFNKAREDAMSKKISRIRATKAKTLAARIVSILRILGQNLSVSPSGRTNLESKAFSGALLAERYGNMSAISFIVRAITKIE